MSQPPQRSQPVDASVTRRLQAFMRQPFVNGPMEVDVALFGATLMFELLCVLADALAHRGSRRCGRWVAGDQVV